MHSGGDGYQRHPGESHELSSTAHVSARKPADPYSMTTLGISSESQEEIVGKDNDSMTSPETAYQGHKSGGILVQKSINVEASKAMHSFKSAPSW